jgi:hypothetical protein
MTLPAEPEKQDGGAGPLKKVGKGVLGVVRMIFRLIAVVIGGIAWFFRKLGGGDKGKE